MANNQTFTLNIKAVADMKDVQSNIQNIQNALSKLKLPDNLKTSFKQTFSSLDRELENYQRLMQSGFKNKGDANALEKSGNNIIRLYDEVVKKINSIDDSTLKKAFEDLGAKEVEKLRQELNGLENDLKSKLGNQKFIDFSATKASLKDLTSQFKDAEGKINSTFKTLSNSTINTFFKNIDIGRLDLAANNLDKIEQQVKELNNTDLNTWFNQLKTGFIQLTSDAGIQGTVHAVEELKQKLATVEANTLQNLINGFKEGKISAEQFQQELTKTVTAEHELAQAQAQTNKEIDQVKSRIQYFFGLNNAINLVKRAIRGAVDTVKDLDKAMTETAVVTKNTVSDMWAKLPEYTQRANELGVSTLDAYKAATLYYQQGLNDEQAGALSVETLKMARIAGLDAAEATDRMTNALRGFNMELNEASAQKVDDVYSQLAAMSASNVDEISTAMTKVASLAHNANMEFETTAAFLAQIIETTRESAETAGTALKTVAARFSEVKKLVNTEQLKGTDEEGQTIDVNKVSTALRTAGIDLNKYFLGEVGLDDIFMELASKWDSLTNVQQRYIATQAAGSRQQSRFIALMQDYARTQELVSAAYNANGASAKQFEKTQESLQSKLARLKNAWNEFLMGLANNAVIKGVVDLLTNLLNIINSLTSAFGEGVGDILKWVAAISAISGLRAAFSDKGIATKAIGALINGTPIGNLLGKAREATALQGPLAANGQGPRQATIIGNIGGIGKSLWGGAQHLGRVAGYNTALGGKMAGGFMSMGATEGLAAGLTGIATALGAVTLAVGAAIAIYQAWLHLSPKGQLKKAEKEAKKAQEEVDKAQKELTSLNSLQDTYKEKTEEVDKATTVSDKATAIKERNQAILNAIQEDGTLAQYVITEQVDNEIVLKVNEAGLKAAAEEATKIAEQAAVKAYFKQADVSVKEAGVARSKLENILGSTGYLDYNTISNMSVEEIYSSILSNSDVISDKYLSQAAELYNQILSYRSSAEQQYKLAYGQELSRLKVSDEITNALLPFLAEQAMKGKNFNTDQLSNVTKQQNLLPLLDTINGAGKLKTITLSDVNIEDDNALLEALGFSKEQLENFATALGIDTKEIYKQLKAQAKSQKAIQQTQQTDIFEKALASGIKIDDARFKQIKELGPELTAQISEIADSAFTALSTDNFSELMTKMIEQSFNPTQFQQIQDFFNNFNLDNPIQAFHQLNEAKKEAADGSYFATLLGQIEEDNAAIFDTGNLLQTFITSDNYDNLTESVEKFIEANGRVTAENIEELADSCTELQYLLEDTEITVQGLAEAFTLLETGALSFDAITTSLLAALSAGESFEGLIDNVSAWIKNFSEGTDLTEGTNHIVDVVKKASEYIEGWQFGNEPLENIYDHLFGEGAFNTYMSTNYPNKGFDQIESDLKGRIEQISSWAENEGLGALQSLAKGYHGGLAGLKQLDEEGLQFEWDISQFETTTQAIEAVATALGVTDDTARAFIESWGSHMWDLRQDWNNLNFGEQMQGFVDNLGNAKVITEQELSALSASTGRETNEIINEINRLREEAGLPIVITVSWQDEKGGNLTGQNLIDKFNEVAGVITTSTNYNGSSLETTSTIDYSRFTKGDFSRIINPEDSLENQINTIDFDTLHQHLIEAFKLTPQQATEIADNIAEQTGEKFSKVIKVPIQVEDGSIEMIEKTVTADSSQGLTAAVNAELEAANVQLVAKKLANLDVSSVGDKLGKSIGEGGVAGVNAIATAIGDLPTEVDVTVTYTEVGRPDKLATGAIIEYESDASGGLIKSYAKGSENFHVGAGTALTGEEGPELVWNKDGGYAYVTGQDGPEFADLRPGDRIFNASETKRIFANSNASGGVVDSFASGGWKTGDSSSKKSGGGSGGSGGGADDKTPEEWKNDLDWLYNLMEDIAELERDQKAIEEQYEDYLSDQTKTGGDLYRLLVKQLGNLYTQLEHQNFALQKREQEMREFMDVTNDQDQYLQYNWQDRTLEIDWDAIDQIRDEELYKHVKELIDEAEEIQDKMDDADDAIMDITNQIQELENIWRDTFTDFEDRVLDAIIKSYQQVIDKYSELNDTLNNSNSQILDSLQKQISLERQIRDNTKTEEEISDEEARLAYLRRDTSGGNELAALQLERELADQRENYEDTLVDQAISRLQEDNDVAAQQRERQIEIMQAQLDYQSENGEFNAYISELLTAAMGADGELLTNSDLVTLLKEQENWDAMSDVSKQVWDEELNGTFKEVAAFLLKQNAEENGTFYTALTAAVKSVSSAIGSYSQAMVKLGSELSGAGGYSDAGGGDGSYTAPFQSKQVSEDEPHIPLRKLGGCFAPGTKILMADNSTQNIEFIKIGDIVIAYNELTREFVPKKVTKSYIHHNTPAMVKLTFIDNSILELTPGHPLYSTHGWKSLDIENSLYEHGTIATLLHIGDEIVGIHGNRIVKSIEWLNIGTNYNSYNIEVEDCHTFLANGLVAHNVKVNLVNRFATGGLADSTGLAWLDGTPQEPEYVLNARQTDAFLKLADVLPSMMNNTSTSTSNTFGATYVNLSVNLESVSPDYDVDRMVDLVKDKLYDAGSYRNINSLSFLR